MSSFEYNQYVPQPDLILDSTTGKFFNPSEFLDSNGNLVPPEGFSFITGAVLQNAMPFPQQSSQYGSSSSMISVPTIPYTNVPSFYYPMANLPSNLDYAANLSAMMQPIQPQLQIPPQQTYLPNYQPTLQMMGSSSNYQRQLDLGQPTNQSYAPFLEEENAIQKDVKTKNTEQENGVQQEVRTNKKKKKKQGKVAQKDVRTNKKKKKKQEIVAQKDLRANSRGFGDKQKAIPQIYEYIQTQFANKNKFVKERTIDGVGATFRVCAKSIESLLGLPRLLLHIDHEISILEISLHVMVRRQTYKKGVTSYIKIKNKEDINRTLDISDLYGQTMTIVSKGDKDTRAPGLEIQIMYKTDSNPSPDDLEFQNLEIDGNEDILMPARAMNKSKSDILTIVFPETGHVVNLNVEGLEDDESDDENYDDESDIKGLGLVAGHLDKRSSLTLQQAVHESLRSAGKKKVKENMDSSDDDDNEKEERVAEIHGRFKEEVLTQNVAEN